MHKEISPNHVHIDIKFGNTYIDFRKEHFYDTDNSCDDLRQQLGSSSDVTAAEQRCHSGQDEHYGSANLYWSWGTRSMSAPCASIGAPWGEKSLSIFSDRHPKGPVLCCWHFRRVFISLMAPSRLWGSGLWLWLAKGSSCQLNSQAVPDNCDICSNITMSNAQVWQV